MYYHSRQLYLKVRRIRDGTATGNYKGLLIGDNSTDPLAANSRTGSADEVRLLKLMRFKTLTKLGGKSS